MNVCILSSRGLSSSVSWDPLYELEDLLVQVCDACLIVPAARGVQQWLSRQVGYPAMLAGKVLHRTIGAFEPNELNLPPNPPNVLLIVGISPADLHLLSSIPAWRQQFDCVAAYIFDAWEPSYYPRLARQLDHLFVPMPEIVDLLHQHLQIPVSLLPFGVDALVHGSAKLDRSIDLMSYGRIPEPFRQTFSRVFNQPTSDRIFYHATPRRSEEYPSKPYEDRDDRRDRLLLFQLLRRTKLVLAFDTLYPGMRTFPYSFLTLRWFEGGAAGCAIVGKRPTTPLAERLLDWEDATIELPDDPIASVAVIEDLLQSPTRLQAIHQRNYMQHLSRHDWRWRIRSLLEQLNLPLPTPLVRQLEQIQQRCPAIASQ
jgi:hypothetical protein